MTKSVNKLPSAFSVQRSFVLTDALMFNAKEEKQLGPVLVVEHGLRGTQNVNTEKGYEKNVTNIQTTETAKLDVFADSLIVKFGLRSAPLSESVVMCSESGKGRLIGKELRSMIDEFLEKAKSEGAVEQLCLRYARNVLNGRWLWRNRTYAQSIKINVYKRIAKDLHLIATEDALKISLNKFENYSENEKTLAKYLAEGLNSENGFGLEVVAYVDFGVGGAVEVYPSQNYNSVKPTGFARSLYKLRLLDEVPELGEEFKIKGHAAIRDQKIGNALRTIDTWYSDYSQKKLVTPVEPMGANLDVDEYLRVRKESAFELLKNLGNFDPKSDDGQFLLANFIRGGMFGEESEDKKDKKNKKSNSEE